MTETELLEHLKQEFAGANIYLVDEIGIYVPLGRAADLFINPADLPAAAE
jgi:hypothetical protein